MRADARAQLIAGKSPIAQQLVMTQGILGRRLVTAGAVTQAELKGRTARKTTSQYEVRVRMSDGSLRTITYSSAPAWKAGDRVRLQNGRVVG